MRVLKSLCRFKMFADVKDSLVVKSPFPVYRIEIETSFCFFSGRLRSSSQLSPKSLLEITFAQSKQICSFDEIHTHVQ